MATATKKAGPMEAIVREMAYIGETDGLLMAARRQDATRAELLHWIDAICEEASDTDDAHDGRFAHVSYGTIAQAMAALVKARGEA